MNKVIYVLIDQTLHSKMISITLTEAVRQACLAGRLDWVTFLDQPVTNIPWGKGLYEVDNAGRMTLVNSFWDTSD